MKKLLLILSTLFISIIGYSQNVTIPDANFKTYLLGSSINTNGDSEIQVSEATAFTGQIICPSMNIADLTGIESFINLTQLTCYSNQITTLDLSFNTSLTFVRVENNLLTSLILNRTNSVLDYLNCTINQLTSFNATEHPLLEVLLVRFNQIPTIDVSQNPLLRYFGCGSNLLTTLNVSQNTALEYLFFDNNQLTTINLSQNILLENISCTNNQLISLDFSQNPVLNSVVCWNNQITSINVTQNPILTTLNCFQNQLTSLDVSQNTALTFLHCNNNPITSLDVSQNTSLVSFGCYNSQLTSLNVQNGNNTNFTYYNSENNPNLICILVDDAAYSAANWPYLDPASIFVNNLVGCASLSIENNDLNNHFSLSPNPTTNYLNVYFNGKIDKIEVYNALGQKVMDTKASIIATKTLTNGVYFIKLYAQNKLGIKQFIKQ